MNAIPTYADSNLTTDHLKAFRDHIDDYVSKTPFGAIIMKGTQETPEGFWTLGVIYSESDEVYRKRCFHPCGTKKNMLSLAETASL